jgi:hypothetical protein
MIYFDSDTSKSTNMVVYCDWKMVFYIYVCGKCRTQFFLPMEKSVTFTGACANETIPSLNRSFVYKAKEGRHVRIQYKSPYSYLCWCNGLIDRLLIFLHYWIVTLYVNTTAQTSQYYIYKYKNVKMYYDYTMVFSTGERALTGCLIMCQSGGSRLYQWANTIK